MSGGNYRGLPISVKLRPAAHKVTERGRKSVHLIAPPRHISLGVLSSTQEELLNELARDFQLVPTNQDPIVPEAVELLNELQGDGWLSIRCEFDRSPIYTVRPYGKPPEYPTGSLTGLILSKFCVIRQHRGEVVIENPRGWCDIVVHDTRVLSIAFDLPSTDLSDEVTATVIRDLRWAGCLVDRGSEIDDFDLRQWSTHELWFHHRSTIGQRGWNWEPMAATNWARDEFDPLPVVHDGFGGAQIALPTPDLAERKRTDPPLARVIDDRHSCRSFDDRNPLRSHELSELLYRSARTRGRAYIDGREVCSRPYPSGGGAYELELYPVVRNVSGLASGMYRYDSIAHSLDTVLSGQSPIVDRLLHSASYTLDERQKPQVLIVIAARPGRLMWTYEQMAYALMLKHVGTLTQTLYLVATAMGLGCVALGTGDGPAFAEATGLDQARECPIGDVAVGRRLNRDRYAGLWDYER